MRKGVKKTRWSNLGGVNHKRFTWHN